MTRCVLGVVLGAVLLLSLAGLAMAASTNGSGGDMPAYYDCQLFTINFKELPPQAVNDQPVPARGPENGLDRRHQPQTHCLRGTSGRSGTPGYFVNLHQRHAPGRERRPPPPSAGGRRSLPHRSAVFRTPAEAPP